MEDSRPHCLPRPHTGRLPLCLVALLAALPACSTRADGDASNGDPTTFAASFDGPSGELPDEWRTGTSNSPPGTRDARWELRADPTAPSLPGVATLVDAEGHAGQAFNLCWRPDVQLADVDVTVAVRVVGGEEDQGGGPAWRIRGADDYYAARWNPLEDNFRVYSVEGGERLQLDSARVRADVDAWHTIRVRQLGDEITCWFDGEELLHATDGKLRFGGGIGLWTKADATTSFDDLRAEPAR